MCVVVLVYRFESVEPAHIENSLSHSGVFSPSFSVHTCKHTHTHEAYPNLIHSKKAQPRWSIVWVLFSTVTAGWDNGEQLNCTQLIYFYLRKQIGCSAEGGRSESPNPTERSAEAGNQGRNLIFTKLCQLQLQLLGPVPFILNHLDNTVFSSMRCWCFCKLHKTYISKVIRG